jgi:hypothetical protein
VNVYIVWDHDRKEHGEAAELEDVFFSREDAEAYTESEDCWSTETTIEERKVLGSLSQQAVNDLIAHVVAGANGGMRVVIGDRTPAQYDRADQMAGYIATAVQRALTKLGYIKEDEDDTEVDPAPDAA